MRTTKDMDYIYTLEGEEILIEETQKAVRAEIIRQYAETRKRNRMTQEELSKRAGISRPNVSRFESGNYNPSLEMMVKRSMTTFLAPAPRPMLSPEAQVVSRSWTLPT